MILNSNPRFYKKISKATTKLVNCLTDFEETSEDHEVCKTYAMSQFQNHRFLDTDERKVDKWISGLCEKFIIHSQPEKAEILKSLKSAFFSCDITESSKAGSQIHYSLLSILLNLSENPVNVEYVAPVPPEKKEEESFDWGKYLLEGEEMPRPSQWANDDTPPDSEDEEEFLRQTDTEKEDGTSHSAIMASTHNTVFTSTFSPSAKLVGQYWQHSNVNEIVILKEEELNEVNIIREVLWLLAGGTNLFVFPYCNGKYNVCDRIISSHLTPSGLKSMLEKIAKIGDIVATITNFVYSTSRHQCQTYEAFSESLQNFMNSFQAELKSIERRLKEREETFLLGDLIQLLSPWFNELHGIGTVLENSVLLDGNRDSNSLKSSRLLGALYHNILDQVTDDTVSGSKLRDALIRIWLDTLCPYFRIMDDWMSSGVLIDPYNEFILKKSKSCQDVKSTAFWLEALSLESDDCMKFLPWLTPVLRNISIVGKSVEVLVSLGKVVKRNTHISLHDMLVQNVSSTSAKEGAREDLKCVAENSTSDAVLHLCFERLFRPAEFEKGENTFIFRNDRPFPLVVQKSIIDLVQVKHQATNKTLLDVFLNEYDLISAFQYFQKFHLMEWGDVMYDFTTSVFLKLSRGEYWADLMSLRASLQEAITTSNPNAGISHIAIALNKEKQKHTSNLLIHTTDIIELICEVRWPLSIIFNEQALERYNILFSYLLQVKRALFSLENLKFDAIYALKKSTEFAQKAHRLSLLRANLLRLVSHWHNFVMTSVIQAEKEEFLISVRTSKNLDAIINAHERFLDRTLSLCLLRQEKQAEKMIQGTLRKIFNLSVVINTKWNRGIQSMSPESIRKCEAEYKECSEFLGIILQNLVSRGAVPLSLQSLAFCLMS